MIELYTDEMKERVKTEIKRYLDGEAEEEIEFRGISPLHVFEAIESLDIEVDGDFDTNGWECDYWDTFSHNDKKYRIFGTAYSGYATIGIDED